ncbi:hypothetical protein M3G47_03370 [Corynebacterium sanguinis]|uniref:hypothetical protein n=1 Tax=Corynebacterium sanguinis TaxID=2594913 RepID=UPI0021A435DF|nr:hypothetical protein [Corynebacterium sanguinis]MCT1492695.1 hypothetical protein [Corynebacterium sanguinis]MCT2247134.1 hypothetical protein [Corynebacterium sanguinis]
MTQSLLAIRDIFADPSALSLDDIAGSMEQLEAVLHAKALIDASFGFICDRDRAGRLVGAKHADAYLKERLGLSAREARERIARGRDLFADPVLPDPPREPEDSAEEETLDEAAARQAAREEARRHAREEQERARKQADKINAEKQAAIRAELDRLVDAARGAHPRLSSTQRHSTRSWVTPERRTTPPATG